MFATAWRSVPLLGRASRRVEGDPGVLYRAAPHGRCDRLAGLPARDHAGDPLHGADRGHLGGDHLPAGVRPAFPAHKRWSRFFDHDDHLLHLQRGVHEPQTRLLGNAGAFLDGPHRRLEPRGRLPPRRPAPAPPRGARR